MNYKIQRVGVKYEIHKRVEGTDIFFKARLSGRINSFNHLDDALRYFKKKISYNKSIEIILNL